MFVGSWEGNHLEQRRIGRPRLFYVSLRRRVRFVDRIGVEDFVASRADGALAQLPPNLIVVAVLDWTSLTSPTAAGVPASAVILTAIPRH